jgi:hypothetical protein
VQNLKQCTLDQKSSSEQRCAYDPFRNVNDPPVYRYSAILYHIPHKKDERHGKGILTHFLEMKEQVCKIDRLLHMVR